jgi:hypothetical protein
MRSEVRLELKRDDDGAVDSATVTWGQNKPVIEGFIIQLVMVMGLAGLVLLFVVPLLGLLMFAGAGAAFWMAVRLPATPRALVFMGDGRIIAPHGMVHHPSRIVLRARQDDVVSFEVRPMSREKDALSEVVLVTELGDLVRVSNNMDDEDAFKVSVTLTRALNAMRNDTLGVSSSVVPA